MECPICEGISRRVDRVTGLDGREYGIHICKNCFLTWAAFAGEEGVPFEEIYDEHFYKIEGRSQQIRYRREKRVVNHLLHFVRDYVDRGKVLDVGSGDGVHVRLLTEAGWEAYGLDVSHAAVEHAREIWGVETICCSIEEAPFAPESFDLIQMRYVLEHLTDPRSMMEKAWRLLRPGGVIRMDTTGKGLATSFQKLINETVLPKTKVIGWHHRRTEGPSWGNLLPPEHNLWFTVQALVILTEGAGFRLLSLKRPHRGDRNYFPDWPFLRQKSWKGRLEYFATFIVDCLGSRFNQGDLLVAYLQKPVVELSG